MTDEPTPPSPIEQRAAFDRAVRQFDMEMLKLTIADRREHEAAARRERIATAALQGLLANSDRGAIGYGKTYAGTAVERADALIAELDRTEGTEERDG